MLDVLNSQEQDKINGRQNRLNEMTARNLKET